MNEQYRHTFEPLVLGSSGLQSTDIIQTINLKLKPQSEYPFAKYNEWISTVEQETGEKIIKLGVGDPYYRPSRTYIEKYHEFLDAENSHLYPKNDKEFTEAIQNWYKERFKVNLAPNEFLPLNGAKDGISHMPLAISSETGIGDEILIPDPGYPGFSSSLNSINRKAVFYNLLEKNNFKIDFEELNEKINNKTKFMWVNFPSNPTGQTASYKDLEQIVNFARHKNIPIVYDNAYSEITFNEYKAPSILEIPGAKDIAVEIGSFSKTFSFAGYRMGWAVGNNQIIESLKKVKSQFDSGMSTSLQQLGTFALNNFDNNWYQEMLSSYKNQYQKLTPYLKSLGIEFDELKGGFYIWGKIPDNYTNSEEFSLKILRERKIFLTPGITFGKNGDRYVRASFCSDIKDIDKHFN